MRKGVVIKLLTISKSSRAFVITQNAFPAFSFDKHNNLFSLMWDQFELTSKFRIELTDDLDQTQLDKLSADLKSSSSLLAKE